MNRNHISIIGLAAAILGGLPRGMQMAMTPPRLYRPARFERSPEESARRMAAAQAKRERRQKRNLRLLWAGKVIRVLTPEADAERAAFYHEYGSGNCSCFISPPCGSCMHPGNPMNQAEDGSCWVEIAA